MYVRVACMFLQDNWFKNGKQDTLANNKINLAYLWAIKYTFAAVNLKTKQKQGSDLNWKNCNCKIKINDQITDLDSHIKTDLVSGRY